MADRLQALSAGGSGGGTNASARQPPAADEDAATASRSSQAAAAHSERAPETPGPGPEAPPLLLADVVIFIGQDTPAVICL